MGSTQGNEPCTSPAFTVYNAGPSLAGLAMREATRLCSPADPDFGFDRRDDVTYVYGDCRDPRSTDSRAGGGGCLPPIEVQSTPLWQKHYSLYASSPVPWPYEPTEVKGAPAASFDGGLLLEIYTGVTTITVYGRDDPSLVRFFAENLKLALEEDIPQPDRTLNALSSASALAPSVAVLPPPDPTAFVRSAPAGA